MSFKHKYAVITVCVLLGLFMVFSGVSGLISGPNPQGVPENMIETTKVLWSTGIFQMIKITEIIAGLMLFIGFLPALAAIFLAPISVGIIVFNAMLAPSFVFIGIIIVLLNGYLGYSYWDKYKQLFEK